MPGLVLAPLAVVAAALAYLFLPRRRPPRERERLTRAVERVDRELAGDLELVTIYLQTRQPAVMEIAAYREARTVIAAAAPELAAALDALYDRIPDTESAMERRGPAASVTPRDRATVNDWEGDARRLQRDLRAVPTSAAPTPWRRLLARLRTHDTEERTTAH